MVAISVCKALMRPSTYNDWAASMLVTMKNGRLRSEIDAHCSLFEVSATYGIVQTTEAESSAELWFAFYVKNSDAPLL